MAGDKGFEPLTIRVRVCRATSCANPQYLNEVALRSALFNRTYSLLLSTRRAYICSPITGVAGVEGFEPSDTRVKVLRLSRLATPQYMDRRAGIEPAMFRNLAGIEPDGQLSHSTILVYLRIYKALNLLLYPLSYSPKMAGKIGLEPTVHKMCDCCVCLYL